MTPARSSSPASSFSVHLLEQFVRLGLRDVVLSPGSRSQALALAAAGLERQGMLRMRVRIDERVAGFLALGLAVESALPVLVVTTSGTAVANLHPAVLEARHAGVPLILATADRPEELRGIGSNQTTEQRGIFGGGVVHARDVAAPTGAVGESDLASALATEAWEVAIGGAPAGRRGPVHLNLAFADPLSGPVDPVELVETSPAGYSRRDLDRLDQREDKLDQREDKLDQREDKLDQREDKLDQRHRHLHHTLRPEPGTVVVAGAGAGEQAEAVARALGAPLLAEISSGARFGPNLVTGYRELISTANFGDRVERVIVFGHPTLSREVPALIQRDGVTTIVVRSPGGDDYNPGRRVGQFADAVRVEGDTDESARSWVGRWVAASRALLQPGADAPAAELGNADFARRELAAIREPVTRRMLVEAVWRATWPHDRLVLGASRLIREADRVVTGKRIPVHANRGLAGIDGTISTAVGIALASAFEGGTTRVLLGDLAALHDAGGLLFGKGETPPRLQVIVGNDGGGTLFDSLEVAATAPAEAFDRVLLTAQRADFEQLAAAYGWDYSRAGNRGELDQALTASARPTLVEVPLQR